MIMEKTLKTASTRSWRSCVAWNILVQPLITIKGTVKSSNSIRHFWECSTPCQRSRNHLGQNTWTMWYTPMTAWSMNQQATHHSSYLNSSYIYLRKWFEPGSISSSYGVIVGVRVVLKRTVVGDWCFDKLSRSHLQSQVNSVCQSMTF